MQVKTSNATLCTKHDAHTSVVGWNSGFVGKHCIVLHCTEHDYAYLPSILMLKSVHGEMNKGCKQLQS